jgi:hypothetical protein
MRRSRRLRRRFRCWWQRRCRSLEESTIRLFGEAGVISPHSHRGGGGGAERARGERNS